MTLLACTDSWTFGTSGSDGEEALREIICGSKRWLDPENGRLHMVTQLMNAPNYADKLQNLWEESCVGLHDSPVVAALDFYVYYGYPVEREDYARWYATSSASYSYTSSLENLLAHNISTVANGYVYGFTAKEQSSFTVRRVNNPRQPSHHKEDLKSNIWDISLGQELEAVQEEWPSQYRIASEKWIRRGRKQKALLQFQ